LTDFSDFGLAEPITRALAAARYLTPTPIQTQTIPLALAGRDIVGIAQTGTGKTAAFALPILNRLAADARRPEKKACRVLVLSPTRELSGQIVESFRSYGRNLRLSSALVIGGVPIGRQRNAIAMGVDILVATPGRLLDLVQERMLRLDQVEVFVLDEADRMLDMGFVRDIRKIVTFLPKERQTMFFSATMPAEIADLAGRMLTNPARVAVTPAATTVEQVAQRVIYVEKAAKQSALNALLATAIDRLIFARSAWRRPPHARSHDAGRKPAWQQVAATASDAAAFRSGKIRTCRHRTSRRADRRDGHQPCHQLRSAECAGELRSPYRAHRARRAGGRGDLAGLGRRDRVSPRHPEADPGDDSRLGRGASCRRRQAAR
jgi:superfamily II DNA/RNA helicase